MGKGAQVGVVPREGACPGSPPSCSTNDLQTNKHKGGLCMPVHNPFLSAVTDSETKMILKNLNRR